MCVWGCWKGGRGTYEVVEDLIPDDAAHFEALLAGDGVDDHVAVDADEVFGVEDRVFILWAEKGRVNAWSFETLCKYGLDIVHTGA